MINCKVDLKHKWTKHCVLAAAGNDNTIGSSNNIIFTIINTKLYVPLVTISGKDNEKLSKIICKGFERLLLG